MTNIRPRVLVNFATSIDGKIAPVPGVRRGAFAMSRHPVDHRRMRELRAKADAIVIGAGNLRADDPDLALEREERERREKTGERQPFRVVVTRRGDDMRETAKLFDAALGGPSIVVHAEQMPNAVRTRLSNVARTIAFGDAVVDIAEMLKWMVDDLGVATLLCEGGGIVCAELFALRAVDELFLTLVPRVLGGVKAPTLVEGPGFAVDAIPEAKLVDLERIGDELFLRYLFNWS